MEEPAGLAQGMLWRFEAMLLQHVRYGPCAICVTASFFQSAAFTCIMCSCSRRCHDQSCNDQVQLHVCDHMPNESGLRRCDFMRLTFDVALYTDPHWSNYLAVTLERNLTKFLRPEESRRHCPDYTGVSRLPQLKCLEVHVIQGCQRQVNLKGVVPILPPVP